MILLKTETLAEQISVSPRTLERWRIEGSGPAFLKAGRRVLYYSKDVHAWLKSNRFLSTSNNPNKLMNRNSK